MLVTKSDKQHHTDGLEQPNQDKIRALGEEGADKYLGILETDIIKQKVMKEKNNISGQPERYSRQNYIAENLSKE